MLTFFSFPAILLASSLFSGAGKLVNALFDDTFTDIYRLQPFDYAILVPYFAVLIVLVVLRAASLSHDSRVREVPQADADRGSAKVRAIAAGDHSAAACITNSMWWSGCSKRPARSIIRTSCCRFRCWTILPIRQILSRAALVAEYQAAGLPIEYIHRTHRHGYKAGALQNGLETATGEIVAIFDADFIPPVDFLRRTVDYFRRS